jgi:hypothetical protein
MCRIESHQLFTEIKLNSFEAKFQTLLLTFPKELVS